MGFDSKPGLSGLGLGQNSDLDSVGTDSVGTWTTGHKSGLGLGGLGLGQDWVRKVLY